MVDLNTTLDSVKNLTMACLRCLCSRPCTNYGRSPRHQSCKDEGCKLLPNLDELDSWLPAVHHAVKSISNADGSVVIALQPRMETGFLNALGNILHWDDNNKTTIMRGMKENESFLAFITASGEAYASLGMSKSVLISTNKCKIVWDQPILGMDASAEVTSLKSLVRQFCLVQPTPAFFDQLLEFKDDQLMAEYHNSLTNLQKPRSVRYVTNNHIINVGEGWAADIETIEDNTSDDEDYAPDSESDSDNEVNENSDNIITIDID